MILFDVWSDQGERENSQWPIFDEKKFNDWLNLMSCQFSFCLQVYAQVEKGDNQDLFVFSVEKCYATTSQTLPASSPTDEFFVNECPVDETVDFSTSDQSE